MKELLALGAVIFVCICLAARKDARLTKSIEASKREDEEAKKKGIELVD